MVKPDDYNGEEWDIRSSIGLDCTLDFEVLSILSLSLSLKFCCVLQLGSVIWLVHSVIWLVINY